MQFLYFLRQLANAVHVTKLQSSNPLEWIPIHWFLLANMYVIGTYICRLLRIPFLIRTSDSHSQASSARYMCNILHCLVNKTIKSWFLFRCWLNNLLAEWATVNRARFGVKWPSVKFLSSRRQLITWATVDYDVISRSLMTSLSPIAPCSSSHNLEQSSLLEYQLLWDGGLIWYSREIGLCTSCTRTGPQLPRSNKQTQAKYGKV